MNHQESLKIKNRQSLFRWTIAKKVSGLASMLILFILIIIVYSIMALKKIREELQEIAYLDVPLTEISNAIEIHQLEQRIAFDELLYFSKESDELSLEKKLKLKQKFSEHKNQLQRNIQEAISLTDRELESEVKDKLIKINNSLLSLQAESNELNIIIERIIQAIHANNNPDVKTINLLWEQGEVFDSKVLDLIKVIEVFTNRRIAMVQKHEETFFFMNISLGIAAIILGILLSLIIIVSIKNNIFRLSKKMLEVRQAISENKSINPNSMMINSSDEIEELAQELSKTIENFSAEIDRREQLSRHLQKIATTDRLTGAFNRLKWEEMIALEINRVQRSQEDLSAIIFDIDFFKKVNDTYGHDVGDIILIEVVKITQKQIRANDSLYRIGGEEFIILTPSTNIDCAVVLAERIRKAIENHIFEQVKHITISMGVAQFQKIEEQQKFIKRADLALYQSKKKGRNQVNF